MGDLSKGAGCLGGLSVRETEGSMRDFGCAGNCRSLCEGSMASALGEGHGGALFPSSVKGSCINGLCIYAGGEEVIGNCGREARGGQGSW